MRPLRFLCLAGGLLTGLSLVTGLPAADLPVAAELPASGSVPLPNVENSVVKIFATARLPDPYKPWTKQAPQESTGSGVVIEGKRILTNAHVALYASQLEVQANQSGDKLPATLEFIAPGIDLAILKLEDESFFDTHAPLHRANRLPAVKDNVMVYGFPTGGTSLSITKGIVSRIEFSGYNFPTFGLRIQIDAAINPGNSGGPALSGDEMIGLAFSKLGGADNIGYIIPNEEVELFLADVADGRYDGKPAMYDNLQTLENPALRTWLKLPKTAEGIIVHQPDTEDPAYPLRQWDLITHIAGTPVDNEGMIRQGDSLRLRFQYLIQQKARNGTVPLTIIRAGKELRIELPVATTRPMLIADLQGTYPTYFICGPLVFSPATSQYLGPISNNARSLTTLSALGSPLSMRRGEKPAFPGEQLVVVSSPFFPHRLGRGYDNPVTRVVARLNGTAVKSLPHLVTLLRDSQEEYFVFEFAGQGGESLVFPRLEMLVATEEILNDNGVRAQGSPELLALWQEKK